MADKTLSKLVFLKGMKILSVLPQGKNPVDLSDDFTIEAWYGAVNDLSDEQFQKAVIFLLRNSKWHPVPVDIRKAAGFIEEAEQGTLSTPEQQWDIFRDRFNSYEISYAIRDNKQYYEDSVTDIVAKQICRDYANSNISEAGNWRSRFINAYNSAKQTAADVRDIERITGATMSAIGSGNNLKLVKP